MTLLLSSSFLSPSPQTPIFFPSKASKASKAPKAITISSSLPPLKPVPFPALDRHATAYHRRRFPTKLLTLLLSKPHHFLPLHILSRCRRYLNPPPHLPLLSLIRRYPSLFALLPSSPLAVTLTPAALSLAARQSLLHQSLRQSHARKLQRLLMLASPHRLLLSKLAHLAPDLGLPPNFRSRVCNSHPSLFKIIHTSFGPALDLVSWNPSLAVPMPPPPPQPNNSDDLIIERARRRFPELRLRRGLNLRRRHREWLVGFGGEGEVNPYEEGGGKGERRGVAVVREVLGMMGERRTLVDSLTQVRREMGLGNRVRGMLVRHPEVFYVSVKGRRDSVFLVEGFDGKGRLVGGDEMRGVRERMGELVGEGRRVRRDKRRAIGGFEEEQILEKEDDEVEEELEGLEEFGVGEDWEEFGGEWGVGEMREMEEVWVGGGGGGRRLEVW